MKVMRSAKPFERKEEKNLDSESAMENQMDVHRSVLVFRSRPNSQFLQNISSETKTYDPLFTVLMTMKNGTPKPLSREITMWYDLFLKKTWSIS